MDEHEDATEAGEPQEQHWQVRLRRPSQQGYASVWAPVMTEQQHKEHEQYVKDNDLPF